MAASYVKTLEKVRASGRSRGALQRTVVPRVGAAALILLSSVAGAARADDAWRLVALYGQSVGPSSQGFAGSGALAAVREWRLGRHFSLAAELYPVFVFNLTRGDLPERPRETVWAFAASPLLSYTFSSEAARIRLRLEAGAGPFWATSQVPAQGTCFNLVDQAGVHLVFRLESGSWISAGVRVLHVSNADLVSEHNPGLTLCSGVVSFSWPARR